MAERIQTERGLSAKEVALSREKYGTNELLKEKTKGFLRKFAENLSDPIIKVLLIAVAAEIALTLGRCNWFEVGGIMLAVLIATTVSTASECGSESAFRRLSEESAGKTVCVLREGVRAVLPIGDVVVGDVLLLSAGETVPADGRLIEGRMTVDQSALNGESGEVLKRAVPSGKSGGEGLTAEDEVFRGSSVTSGSACMRVEKVGAATYFGMVAKEVQTQTRRSPLQLRLKQLAGQISRIGYVMAGVVAFVFLFCHIVALNGYAPDRILATLRDVPGMLQLLIRALTLSITVIVVAVPEGLPMMITVVLSANMKRMLKDKIMVKKLIGIETAGSMNILFTDKTGTLTTGKTTCDKIVIPGGEEGYSSYRRLRSAHPAAARAVYISAIATCEEGSDGNATDRALRAFFGDREEELPRFTERLPFTSERKFSAVRAEDGSVFVKGAPEIVCRECKYILSENGEKIAAEKGEIDRLIGSMSEQGGRMIAFAYCDGGTWVFLGLAVLKDRLRRGVRESVSRMSGAGVQVVMMTGDGKETAAAVAKECGILRSSEDIVLDRERFAQMTDGEIACILPSLRVLSRALPQDKTRLVRICQNLDLVVGMTGDGVNDAPSLKLADIGFAMGAGTDVAKEAADIVLLDNSFTAITKTVLYGRTIFHSIRKFITFQLIMNFAACGVTLFGQFFGISTPITIVQMLWVNIIMDTLGGLAFAGEAPLGYYMKERPKSRDEKILTPQMLRRILITGAYTLCMCVAFLKIPFFRSLFRVQNGDTAFLTGFYALFIFAGIFNSFNTRSERLGLMHNIGKNKAFLVIMSAVSVIQLLMIYFGGALFRCTPLTARELLTVVLLAASVIPFDFFRRVAAKLA